LVQEVTMSTPSLEQRIAGMLSAAGAKSDAIAALITEVEAAAQEADATATKVHEQALDPAVVIDAAKVGAAVASSMLVRDRLQAALPRLQQQIKQARAQEYEMQWRKDYAEVETLRDEAGQLLHQRYPGLVDELVALMNRIADADKQVSYVNRTAPPGVHDRLEKVGREELKELRLPHLVRSDGYAYPPPQPTLAQEMARAMMANPSLFNPPGPGPNWHEEIEARDRKILEENRRQIAEAEARQRAREESEAAEARKAQEADRAAYFAKHGWGPQLAKADMRP